VASLVLLSAVTIAALLIVGPFLYGLLSGYPPPQKVTIALSRKEQAIVRACADAMFPERGAMPLTGSEAGVVEYFDRHLAELPPDKRFQIRLLLFFIEHSPCILRPPSLRFTAMKPSQQSAFLSALSLSRSYFLRVCFVSLRTLLCMAYLSHPDIAARIGSAPNLRPFEKGSAQ
jgi:hypothetical protein